jgi:uncharacterized protein with alpha-helical domain and ER motif
VLARIAQELFWLGRNLARAEQMSRLLDGVFQADLQGRPEDPSSGRLGWDSLMHIMGASRDDELPTHRDAVLDALTFRQREPGLGRRLRRPCPRGRDDRPRRHLGRDVGGDRHDPPAPARRRPVRAPVLGAVLDLHARRGALGPYLWAAPTDGGDDSVEVETHARLEALLPGQDGRGEPLWVGADPTNRQLAGERHVKIGHGRHYADVPPVRGVFQGGASSTLDASVHMTRLDPQASAAPMARARRLISPRVPLALDWLADLPAQVVFLSSCRHGAPNGPRRRANRCDPRM